MTDRNASVGRTLDRLAEIAALEEDPNQKWWRKLATGAARTFSLVQNDSEIAQIRTVLEDDASFGWGVSCRQTEVSFENAVWAISTHRPRGSGKRRKILWFSTGRTWLLPERIVEVTDRGEQIAHLAHLADGQPLAARTVDGRSLSLIKQSRHLLEADALTIKKVKGGYVLATTSPVPLEAALLYWHLMLGDYQRSLPFA